MLNIERNLIPESSEDLEITALNQREAEIK
jgi:hypothetical protein